MTKDTSPENLRKFLESDDPAMRRMGLSMAKGSGVPEELLPTILGLYMWDDDKIIRAAAKSVFTKYAPAEIQVKIKENWKPSYRTLSITGDKFSEAIRQFLEAFKSQDDFTEIVWQRAESLIEALMDRNRMIRLNATEALGKIGNERAVEPLIKTLENDWDFVVRLFATEALGKIGDARAVEPLIMVLYNADTTIRIAAAEALGMISGGRAVEPLWLNAPELSYLIKALGDEDEDVRASAKAALRKLGHEVE
jgi:HEAT repeat protein